MDALYKKIPNSMLHKFVSRDGAMVKAKACDVHCAGCGVAVELSDPKALKKAVHCLDCAAMNDEV